MERFPVGEKAGLWAQDSKVYDFQSAMSCLKQPPITDRREDFSATTSHTGNLKQQQNPPKTHESCIKGRWAGSHSHQLQSLPWSSQWLDIDCVTDTNQISCIHSYYPLNFLILFLIPSLVYIFRYHLLIFLWVLITLYLFFFCQKMDFCVHLLLFTYIHKWVNMSVDCVQQDVTKIIFALICFVCLQK